MPRVYFNCSNTEQTALIQYETNIDNLAEARDRAAIVVHLLITTPAPVDWRPWALHASNDLSEEIFALHFSSIIGRFH
jgi:hypothetical protein